jgi:hypothetical protein
MAITDYASLRVAINKWSNRRDGGPFIDDFIRLAEIDMYGNEDESIRLRDIETRVTDALSTSSRYLALPAGYKSMRSIRIDQTDINDRLEYVTPQAMRRRDGTGQPCFYTITNQLEFDVLPDEAYVIAINYYAIPTGISEANTTNTVLTSNPNIYLFGCLYHFFLKVGDDQNAIKYKGLFDGAIKGANRLSMEGRYTPTLTAISDSFTP